MITQIKAGQFDVNEYIFDNTNELTELPTNCGAGSNALCIENKKVYMLNGEKTWIEI